MPPRPASRCERDEDRLFSYLSFFSLNRQKTDDESKQYVVNQAPTNLLLCVALSLASVGGCVLLSRRMCDGPLAPPHASNRQRSLSVADETEQRGYYPWIDGRVVV